MGPQESSLQCWNVVTDLYSLLSFHSFYCFPRALERMLEMSHLSCYFHGDTSVMGWLHAACSKLGFGSHCGSVLSSCQRYLTCLINSFIAASALGLVFMLCVRSSGFMRPWYFLTSSLFSFLCLRTTYSRGSQSVCWIWSWYTQQSLFCAEWCSAVCLVMRALCI